MGGINFRNGGTLTFPGSRGVNLGSSWRQPNKDFGLYAEAFHEAAQELTRALLDDPGKCGFEACPVIYLYRHATELYLKSILRAGEELLDLQENTPTFDSSKYMNHPLRPMLGPLKEIMEAQGGEDFYREIEGFVRPLDELDGQSFALRYPINKKSEPALPGHLYIDVVKFANHAEDCLKILYELTYSLEARREDAIQSLSEIPGGDR